LADLPGPEGDLFERVHVECACVQHFLGSARGTGADHVEGHEFGEVDALHDRIVYRPRAAAFVHLHRVFAFVLFLLHDVDRVHQIQHVFAFLFLRLFFLLFFFLTEVLLLMLVVVHVE